MQMTLGQYQIRKTYNTLSIHIATKFQKIQVMYFVMYCGNKYSK